MTASRGMTRNVVSCTEACTIEEIMETMTRGRFRHLPVIKDDALVGIVSIGDIVKHHTAEVELEVTAMRGYLATG
jgi:CBS domain-containing protein